MSHVSNYNFAKDKILGDEAEDLLVAMLRSTYPNVYRVHGKESRFDVVVPASDREDPALGDLTFEVKNDLRSSATGNLAIEIGRRTGLSGITVSTADYWAIRSGNIFYLAKREDLINYVFDSNNNFREVDGGDNNATTMKLVPLVKIAQQPFFGEFSISKAT